MTYTVFVGFMLS